MKMKKVSGGSLCDNVSHFDEQPRFAAYIDGKLQPVVTRPVVVHVRGKQPPFDTNLDAYWHFEQKAKHALRLAAKRERKGEAA